jgi:hypothetical protein
MLARGPPGATDDEKHPSGTKPVAADEDAVVLVRAGHALKVKVRASAKVTMVQYEGKQVGQVTWLSQGDDRSSAARRAVCLAKHVATKAAKKPEITLAILRSAWAQAKLL